MRIEVAGRAYWLDFVHVTRPQFKAASTANLHGFYDAIVQVDNGYTDCIIVPIDGLGPNRLGRATVSLHDNFNKRIGRKISFGRAIASMEMPHLHPHDTRRLWWEAYFKLMPQDKRSR